MHHRRMLRCHIGLAIKALRKRKGWRQRDLGARVGTSQQTMARMEAGRVDGMTVALLHRTVAELGADLVIEVRFHGDRPLTDARHAAIQEWLAALLRSGGWEVWVEASFNHYGDRGRIDLMAFHSELGILLVVEIKTRIQDVQDTVGRLDVKERLARTVAEQRGWRPTVVVPAFVVLEGRTARRRIEAHPTLFARFSVRGRAARAWLDQPTPVVPAGILMFVTLPNTPGVSARQR